MSQSNEEPPGPDVSGAPKLIGITGGLYLVILVVFGSRMYTRLRPASHLGWDDYTITIALVLALIEWAFFLASVKFGVGRHNYYIPYAAEVTAQRLLYASEIPWAASIMFIKISIACMLLRFKRTRGWVILLSCMIGVQIASCIAAIIFQLLLCMPLAAVWDPMNHPDAVCAKPQAGYISIYVNLAIAITTDLLFAALPISFIWKIHRPLLERIVVAILMGLGVFAAITSIVKMTHVKSYGITGDTLWDTIDISLWSMLEEQIGIIVACIPCLKSPFERLLGRLGLLSIIKRETYYPTSDDTCGRGEAHEFSSLKPGNGLGGTRKNADAQSEENILPAQVEENVFKRGVNGQIVKTNDLHFTEEARMMVTGREEHGKVDEADKSWHKSWQAV